MYPSVEQNGHESSRTRAPLSSLRTSLERHRDRYKPTGILDYINQVDEGVIPPPPRNAADLVVQALTQEPPVRTPAGHLEYPVFSGRKDALAILGVVPSIEDYMQYLEAERRFGTQDRVAVLVGPTGAAKSTVNKVVLKELERFTDQAEPPSVYGIEGCPINEDPLHVLDPETRERFKAEKGINVHGELCPDCQEKAEDSLKKDSLGFVTKGGYVPLDLKVKPLQFSAKMQRGIGRIDPQTFIDRNAPDLLAKAIMSSNRGVLHLAEMGRMDPAFLVSLNDLFRGRNFSRGGKQYEMDALIIGEMTLDELGGLYDKAPRSLIERLDLIEITYPLDPIAEEGILQKRIRTSRLANSPHISPRSLELVAETVVRTRLVEFKDGQEHVLSVGQKADLYSGKNVNGFTQSDRKKIEEDGRARSEGSFGMSPPELWNIVYQVASEQIRKSGEGNTCLDFVELKKQLEDYILHGFLSDSDRVMYSAELSAVAKKYDGWLLQTIERAYQDRFSERADQAVADYINEVDYLLDPRQVKVDPKTGEEVPIDIQFVTAFENDISDKTLNNDDTKPNSRRGFRIRMQNVAGRIIQEKKKRGDEDPQLAHVDFYSQLPGFEKGIKDFLKKQGLEDPKEALQSLTPNEEQSKKLTEMEGRLVREHGFCECCAPKLRIYVRDLLRKGQV